jgi:protein arginine kinase
MLHLPALRRSGQLAVLSSTISKLGLTLRGAYGEGRESRGDIYQLSNQITLGITEQAAIENLQSITRQLVTQERAAAERMCADVAMQDKIYRALGILQSARVLSCDEMMDLISLVRLGSARGILDIPIEKLNELLVNMQPATISAANGKHIDARQRDCLRADAVREALS